MDEKMMEEGMKMMHQAMHKEASAAGVAAGGALVGGGAVQKLLSSPLGLFSLGAAAGILAYRYRNEILKAVEPVTKEVVRTAMKVADAGKDLALEQKERLSDIIAEIREEEEEMRGEGEAAG